MTKKFNVICCLMVICAMVLLTSGAQADTLYSNDFSISAGHEWSNTSIATSLNGLEKYLASSMNGFGSGTVTLTLSGLTVGSTINLGFDLYIIGTMDGNGLLSGGADNWELTVNGTQVIYTNFANYTGSNTQAYPAMLPPLGPGASNAPRTDEYASNHLGFGTGDTGDATYQFSMQIVVASSTEAFAFTSYQTTPPPDEGWGLDNVLVTGPGAVPLPSSVLLLGPGLVGLAAIRRRFKN